MKTQKLTPKQKNEIAVRVAAGEKQADLVKEYGVSPALVSRVVKQSRSVKQKSGVPVSMTPVDLSGKTTEQLQNRYKQIQVELLNKNEEIKQRHLEVDALQRSIEVESAKADDMRDESWIMAQKKRLVWCQDTTRIAYEVARLHQEASAIAQTYAKRGETVPVLTLLPSVVRGRG